MIVLQLLQHMFASPDQRCDIDYVRRHVATIPFLVSESTRAAYLSTMDTDADTHVADTCLSSELPVGPDNMGMDDAMDLVSHSAAWSNETADLADD